MHFLSALCLRVFTRQVQVLSPCGHSLAGARLIPDLHAYHCAFGAALARCAGIQNWLTVVPLHSFAVRLESCIGPVILTANFLQQKTDAAVDNTTRFRIAAQELVACHEYCSSSGYRSITFLRSQK